MAAEQPISDDSDLKLVKASAKLLSDLEKSLPRALYKRAGEHGQLQTVHKFIQKRDLEYTVKLIEPFQADPQLLDSKLATTLSFITTAFTLHLTQYRQTTKRPPANITAYTDVQTSLSTLLYTFCKVRGPKIISSFLPNEPKYIEPILADLEKMMNLESAVPPQRRGTMVPWQNTYISLLWLAHLLLTPFDLGSISTTPSSFPTAASNSPAPLTSIDLLSLPPLAARLTHVALFHLSSATKAQDAAAGLLNRLITRPDMRPLRIAESLCKDAVQFLEDEILASPDPTTSITQSAQPPVYSQLGALKLLAGIAASASSSTSPLSNITRKDYEGLSLGDLVPAIFRVCRRIFDNEADDDYGYHDNGRDRSQMLEKKSALTNAVAKKLGIKIYRHAAILALRVAGNITTDDENKENKTNHPGGVLQNFLETSSILEEVVDYLLRSLSDKDTPVRYAAAKSLSSIVLDLDPELGGHEVIQAILDTLKEDLPTRRSAPTLHSSQSSHGSSLSTLTTLDFATANPLKWHGLTLALAHTLFKRSAAPEQLPDILDALFSASQFQQRTATGTTLGANVRDAANFGIWALARRYTTNELLSVQAGELRTAEGINSSTEGDDRSQVSIIQLLAEQLILCACLDPAGNIRRGASAALQELVGRHPDQVGEGIALVQIVDYQAVGLRHRAMIDVVDATAVLRSSYWTTLLDGLLGWRGLGSSDAASRKFSAGSLAKMAECPSGRGRGEVFQVVWNALQSLPTTDTEGNHGHILALANILHADFESAAACVGPTLRSSDLISLLKRFPVTFSARVLQSELPVAVARFLAAEHAMRSLTLNGVSRGSTDTSGEQVSALIDETLERLLACYEDETLLAIADLVVTVHKYRVGSHTPLGCVDSAVLRRNGSISATKRTLHGAGNVVALGALAAELAKSDKDAETFALTVNGLCNAMQAVNVDWRIMGARALVIAIKGLADVKVVPSKSVEELYDAVHRGLNDYTIDERGDVGSLMRLQSLECASQIFATHVLRTHERGVGLLRCDVLRLSLEKLDRVRYQAALCRKEHIDDCFDVTDIASVSRQAYFASALGPLADEATDHVIQRALLEGCISCAGHGQEALVRVSRTCLAATLRSVQIELLDRAMGTYAGIMKSILEKGANCQPAVELFGFLLDAQVIERLAGPAHVSAAFRWRTALSHVQKAHHKSNDIPKILAAVHVYVAMADVSSIRHEVVKKLISMLQTNPYPRVRVAVAEALWVITREARLRTTDCTEAVSQNVSTVQDLRRKYLEE